MKKLFCTLLLPILTAFINTIFAQTPVDVAENTFKVGGLGEEVFYYGFAEGDQIIFNFTEENGKDLKEVEIIELPSSSKFMDYKIDKIENKTINVTHTGVYKFRFYNSAISGRVCKIKIQRIPAKESTKNFNTNVLWRTIYDTTYTTSNERYLIKKEYIPKQLVKDKYYINSGSNALLKGGRSRITVPILVPENTVKWYYVFSSSRNETEVAKTNQSMSLAGELAKLIDHTGIAAIGANMLTQPPGGNACDVFLFDYTNASNFEQKLQCQNYSDGSRENIASGVVQVLPKNTPNLYIGIRNPDATYGIHVCFDAVAIVLHESYGMREVKTPHISSRKEAYMQK